MKIDVVRKPIVRMVHKVELDGIPLPNTNKFAGHSAAKCPERVCDTLGYRKDDLLGLQLHNHLGRLTSWEWWWDRLGVRQDGLDGPPLQGTRRLLRRLLSTLPLRRR